MPSREFKEFLDKNIIIKRKPDLHRADYLFHESEKRNNFLNDMKSKIGLSESNANYFIENVYAALIELIRAKLSLEGYKSHGEGAHEAEVSFLRKLGFPESDVRYMNDIRYFRNSIKYYGKTYDKETAEKTLRFFDKIYPILKKKYKGD